MRFDMWKSKAQKGAFLVFTALMIPIIFLCAGFAVDLGNAWAYKSKLQNAADAAVLAGAYQYQADANDKNKVEDRIDKYMNANNGGIPFSRDKKDDNKNGIFYRFPQKGSSAKGLLLTLHVSEEAPTTFSKMFGFGSLHVAVVSTARILPSSGGGSSGGNDAFSYAIIGAASRNSEIMKKLNRWNPYSVWFNCNGLTVKGKIYANDWVRLDGPRQVYLENSDEFSTSENRDYKLWAMGNNVELYKIYTTNGTPIYAEDHYVPLDKSPYDISLSKDNPKTSAIYDYIENLKQKYHDVESWSDFPLKDDVYISTQPGSPYSNFTDWRTYKTIIAYGDIHCTVSTFKNFTEDDHITVISLNGNIIIDGYDEEHNILKGLFYAPNGIVNFNTNVDFEGSLVGQQVIFQNNAKHMKWSRFDFPGGGESSPGSIKLYADIDSDYEPTT